MMNDDTELLAIILARKAEREWLDMDVQQYSNFDPYATARLEAIARAIKTYWVDHYRHVYEVRGIDGLIKELYR